ncbi:MAG: thiol oxidoreductase, partial [Verrucomicrobiae bacterium]|nr:thiol oxidoreductase [Verrucomicrobiae bacterium]
MACHFRAWNRRYPPQIGGLIAVLLLFRQLLLRQGVLGTNTHGVPAEADASVEYEMVSGSYGDGEPYTLRRPRYVVTGHGYGPFAPDTMLSPRVAPIMPGTGLLEAVPEETLRQLADRRDR